MTLSGALVRLRGKMARLVRNESAAGPGMPPGVATGDHYLSYTCNICGQPCRTPVERIRREEPDCPGCGSTLRMRAVIEALSVELYGKGLPISEFPVRPDIVGIGMSDWDGYAVRLPHRVKYRNTYYHKEPRLDIKAPDPDLEGTLDFIISSDVFEHVAPPIQPAFDNVYRLLKPGGVFILTVPYTLGDDTLEHFPELHDYRLVKTPDGFELVNVTRDGVEQRYTQLVFHGGEGEVLEMRVFSEAAVIEHLRRAGFRGICVRREPNFNHGVYWPQHSNAPFVARK